MSVENCSTVRTGGASTVDLKSVEEPQNARTGGEKSIPELDSNLLKFYWFIHSNSEKLEALPFFRTFHNKLEDQVIGKQFGFEDGFFQDTEIGIKADAGFFKHRIREKPYFDRFIEEAAEAEKVVDIGACKGTFSVYAAKLGCTMIAVEADSLDAKKVRETLELNNLDARVVDKAFYRGSTEFTTVLDDVEITSETVVKIDVDGGEVEVLEALKDRLYSSPVVFLECHSGELSQQCKEILDNCGLVLEEEWTRGEDLLQIYSGGDSS